MTRTTYTAARPRRALVEKFTTLAAAAILLTSAAACASDSSTAPTPDYSGTYSLQSIDQAALPTKIFDGSASDNTTGKWYKSFVVTVKNGTLDLDTQGHYRTSFDYTLVLDGVAEDRTLVAQGTYEIKGDKILLMRDNGTDTGEGSVKAGEVTVELTLMTNDPSKPFTFRK